MFNVKLEHIKIQLEKYNVSLARLTITKMYPDQVNVKHAKLVHFKIKKDKANALNVIETVK